MERGCSRGRGGARRRDRAHAERDAGAIRKQIRAWWQDAMDPRGLNGMKLRTAEVRHIGAKFCHKCERSLSRDAAGRPEGAAVVTPTRSFQKSEERRARPYGWRRRSRARRGVRSRVRAAVDSAGRVAKEEI